MMLYLKNASGSPMVHNGTINNNNSTFVDYHANSVSNKNSTNNHNNSTAHYHFHHYNYSNYYNNLMMKTSSFHVTQIVRLKQYKGSKNPTHFKIVFRKVSENGKQPNKRYDLEALNIVECDQIIQKIKWVQNVYKNNMNFGG